MALKFPVVWRKIALHSFDPHLKEFGSPENQLIFKAPRVHLYIDKAEKHSLENLYRLHLDSPGFEAEWLDRDQLGILEPRLNPMFQGGLLSTGNYQVNSHQYTHNVAQAAVDKRAEIIYDRLLNLGIDGTRATEVRLSQGKIQCGLVVWATGPWTSLLDQFLSSSVPVQPVKGDLLVLDNPEKPFVNDFTWGKNALYVKSNGEHWLGGTEELTGFDEEPGVAARESILSGCAQMIPSFREAEVRAHFSGLRPVAQDHMPILGKLPGWDNIYIATGGGRKGMLLSAACGMEISDLIVDQVVQYPEFSLKRFLKASTSNG